jgi:hypothetical protein
MTPKANRGPPYVELPRVSFMTDCRGAVRDVEFPFMRGEVIEALQCLADTEYQQRRVGLSPAMAPLRMG